MSKDANFLDAPEDRPGRYTIVRDSAERAMWLERVLNNRIDIEDVTASNHQAYAPVKLLEAIDELPAGVDLISGGGAERESNPHWLEPKSTLAIRIRR